MHRAEYLVLLLEIVEGFWCPLFGGLPDLVRELRHL